MYTISVSAATSLLITTSVRDNPFRTLYENYCLMIRDEQTLRDVPVMMTDVSTSEETYQHFDVVGASIGLPAGKYSYTLYTASASTEASIIYNALEEGFVEITE